MVLSPISILREQHYLRKHQQRYQSRLQVLQALPSRTSDANQMAAPHKLQMLCVPRLRLSKMLSVPWEIFVLRTLLEMADVAMRLTGKRFRRVIFRYLPQISTSRARTQSLIRLHWENPTQIQTHRSQILKVEAKARKLIPPSRKSKERGRRTERKRRRQRERRWHITLPSRSLTP